jgi:HD-GYP domain-containing protein (c-di-GMP phosphodiesterase class II)
MDWDEFSNRPVWEYELELRPSELKLGHFVRRMNIPWQETDFPLQGVLVDSLDLKRWFQLNCSWVVVDLDRSPNKYRPARLRVLPATDASSINSYAIQVLRRSPINQTTLNRAIDEYQRLDRQADRLIEQIERTGQMDVPSAIKTVDNVADALEDNLAALVWLTRIKQKDRYTAQHCINVAIVCMGLAVGLQWSRDEIRDVGLAGLLHDLGKVKVDAEILKKSGRLSSSEFEEVKKHSRYGFEMLLEDGLVSRNVAEAVLCHHEQPDGKGYPQGLVGTAIPPLARLISVVDAYDAITSHRSYDPARSHHLALGILWKQRGTQFDQSTVESLIRFMGWITPGTLVYLSTGLLAVVLESPYEQGLKPLVALLTREGDHWRLGKKLDLNAKDARQTTEPIHIKEVLPDGYQGIDIRQIGGQIVAARHNPE